MSRDVYTEAFPSGAMPELWSIALRQETPPALLGHPTDTVAGFGYTRSEAILAPPNRDVRRTLTVPHWFIALLCLPLPLIAIRRWRKKRRIAREGLCKVCGYDLRASVKRCPECGTGIETRGVAS